MGESLMQQKKSLYICNSPFQLLHAINMRMSISKNEIGDLLILNLFDDIEGICKRLEEQGLFENVYIASRIRRKYSKFVYIKRIVRPQSYISDFEFSDNGILNNKYNVMYQGDIQPLELVMYSLSNKPEIVLYEDGTGSYSWDTIIQYKPMFYKALATIFRSMELSLRIRELYVTKPQYCKSKICKRHMGLPEITKDSYVYDCLKRVFDYKENSKIKSAKVIVLDQPLIFIKGCNVERYENLIKGIDTTKYNCLMRKHPSTLYTSGITDIFENDSINNMWELECIENICDDHILISICSNAMISPAAFTNNKPYLIFLYKMLVDKEIYDMDPSYEEFSERIQDMYSGTGKVFFPKTEDEFYDILSTIYKV